MFGKILVALDQGETCAALFQQALTLAQLTGAKLMLLSVLEPSGDASLMMSSYYGYPLSLEGNDNPWLDLYREAEAQGLTMLRAFTAQAITAGVPTEFTQATGSPGRAICTLAKTWEADLIMVGSHGHKALSEMFLGSVSNYVMHHAPCSTLVVDAQTLAKTTVKTTQLATVEG